MPRPANKEAAVYNFLLAYLEQVYKESHSSDIRHKKGKEIFPTKTSLVNLVFNSSQFCEYSATPNPAKIEVSYSTVRKAIDELVAQDKIAKGKDGYEYVPPLKEELKHHPILQFAPEINIEVNAPENLLFLRVDPNISGLLINYLNAQFYEGDILFIPLGPIIMCVGLYPKDALDGKKIKKISPHVLRCRIESVLGDFDLSYPDFAHGCCYELGFTARYHKPTRDAFEAILNANYAEYKPVLKKPAQEERRHRLLSLFGHLTDLHNQDLLSIYEAWDDIHSFLNPEEEARMREDFSYWDSSPDE